MNAPPPQPEQLNVVDVGGGMIVPTQPQEMAYPLRRDTFDLLCETETINEDLRWRDIALAFFAASFAGIVGLLGSIDWTATLTNKSWTPIIATGALGVLTFSSFIIFLIQRGKIKRKPVATGYWRAKQRIIDWYQEHHVR